MAQAEHAKEPGYFFPHGSRLPFFGSASLFVLMAGAAATLNGAGAGAWVLGAGFLLLCALFFFWFGQVISENQAGLYNEQVGRSFRLGMMWFIFSEVMFFAAFFGALFYARQLSVPWLGGEGEKAVTSLLWPGFEAGWPSNGPGALSPRDERQLRNHPGLRPAGREYDAAADLRPYADNRAPRPERRASHDAQGLPGD